MTQELLTLANEVLRSIDEMENHIFTNYRAKYAYAKSIMDNYREDLKEIIDELNGNPDDESASALMKEINDMKESVLAAQDNGIINPINDMETLNSAVNTMISDLDSNTPETVMPTANIDVQAIENAIPMVEANNVVQPQDNIEQATTIEASQPEMAQPEVMTQAFPTQATEGVQVDVQPIAIVEGAQDVVPEVPQIIIEEAPMTETVIESTPEPQIIDNAQPEVIETVTPDIVIVSDQPNQTEPSQTIEVPNVEPMIQVPNIEIGQDMAIADTTQESQA